MKRKVVTLMMSALLAVSLTACGGDAPKQEEVKQEATQNEAEDNGSAVEETKEDENSEQGFSDGDLRAITFEYHSYLQGAVSEEDLEIDMSMYNLSIEEAKTVYEEHGAEYGYVNYEPSEEILNSNLGDSIMQFGDVVVNFPCTLGEFMEQTGAVVADKEEALQQDFAMIKNDFYLSKCTIKTPEAMEAYNYALLKTQDGSFVICGVGVEFGEVKQAKDLIIHTVITGSFNAFAPGGIRAGQSLDEVNEIFNTKLTSDNPEVSLESDDWFMYEGDVKRILSWHSSERNIQRMMFYANNENGRLYSYRIFGLEVE